MHQGATDSMDADGTGPTSARATLLERSSEKDCSRVSFSARSSAASLSNWATLTCHGVEEERC